MIGIKISCPVSSLSCLCIARTSKEDSTGMNEMVEFMYPSIYEPAYNISWKEVEGLTTSTSLSIRL
jgi:hypothetical protein